MDEKLAVMAQRARWYDGVEILIAQGNAFGVNVEMREHEPGEMVEPTLKIDDKAAQVLIDDLFAAGFRPTEGQGSAGQLKATEKHLDDMRRLVFDEKKVKA